MPITTLQITNFRNLREVGMTLAPSMNIIYGQNGSGKTSVLEAIYYLGLTRSFRTSNLSRLIQQGQSKFCVFSQILSNNDMLFPAGVERDELGVTRIRIAEKDTAKVTELAQMLPIQLINSHSYQILELGPAYRRKYVDWGLFYQSDAFLPAWRNFERTLKQRNAILKEKKPKNELNVWTTELIEHGLILDALRRDYLTSLAPLIKKVLQELIELKDFNIHYHPGWDEEQDYATILNNCYGDDYRLGYTQFGAHRADIDINANGFSAKHFLSRGQQKLLIYAMILAQGMLLTKLNKNPIYLVDDLPSELDSHSREQIISLLAKQQAQIFITAIEHQPMYDFLNKISDQPMKVFHVEQGNICEMINNCHQS